MQITDNITWILKSVLGKTEKNKLNNKLYIIINVIAMHYN